MIVVLFWIIVVLLLLVLLGSFVTYQLTFAPKRRTAEEIMDSMPCKRWIDYGLLKQ